MKKMIAAALVAVSGFLMGCEKEEFNKIWEAQLCLDEAKDSGAQGKAAECVAKVDGLDSADASRIRCSGTYIMRGFTGTTFKNMYTAMKSPAAGTDASLNMIAYVTFSGTDAETGRTAADDSNYVVTECKKSGSPALTSIAGATKAGAALVAIGGTCAPTDTGCWNGLAGGVAGATPAQQAELGNAALVIHEANCKSGSGADSDMCKEINAAIAAVGTDPAALGAKLGLTLTQN